MLTPPAFSSLQDHIARRDDVPFWRPYLAEIVARHGLTDATHELVAGHNVTYPTFLYGDVVIKLFGYALPWRVGFIAERATYALLATDPEIAAPHLIAAGSLFEDDDAAPWPYLITTKMPGIAAWRADLSPSQWHALATDLGRQVRRVYALPTAGVVTPVDWSALDVTAAAERSSLPPHLAAQAADYLTTLAPFDLIVVHGDLVQNHAYVEDGRLVGIIDWGDTIVADRHYEIIQVYRDMFNCDMFNCEAALLRVFLEAAHWPAVADFPRQALGMALYRQAVGLTQHHTIDVFMPVAAKYPLHDIPTLDDLAATLFAL